MASIPQDHKPGPAVILKSWAGVSPCTEIHFERLYDCGAVITIGSERIVVGAQDLLNVARLMGAKDLDAKIK